MNNSSHNAIFCKKIKWIYYISNHFHLIMLKVPIAKRNEEPTYFQLFADPLCWRVRRGLWFDWLPSATVKTGLHAANLLIRISVKDKCYENPDDLNDLTFKITDFECSTIGAEIDLSLSASDADTKSWKTTMYGSWLISSSFQTKYDDDDRR